MTFQPSFSPNLSHPPQQVAVFVTSEYEGITHNGGIGTYYRTLSEQFTAAGFYIILLLAQTSERFQGKSSQTGLNQVFSLTECPEVLNLSPQQQQLLSQLKPEQWVDRQNYWALFFIQSIAATFPNAYLYIEFPEMLGLGYRTLQAKQTGLLNKNCIIAVTLHSGQEWMIEAHGQYVSAVPHWFLSTSHYEQYCFKNADLAFFLSYFLKEKVEQYGWKTDHALHLPLCFSVLHSSPPNPVERTDLQELIQNNKIPLVFFGRLEERKGLLTFLEAIESLDSSIIERIYIIFLGKNVPFQIQDFQNLDSKQYIKKRLEKNYNYSIVTDLFRQEAINFIRCLSHPIICLTSHQENFPNTALEMGQLPISLVVSDTGGFRETLSLIERTAGIYWFRPKDSKSLLQALLQAISAYPEALETPLPKFFQDINQCLLDKRRKYMTQILGQLELSSVYLQKESQPIKLSSVSPQKESQPRQWLLGMTSMEEQCFLEDYARNTYSGQGEIVELGCWLGSSSISLAQGLEANSRVTQKSQRIHAYDLFIWFSLANMEQSVIGTSLEEKYKDGDSFLDEYLNRITSWQNLIQVYPGDLTQLGWNQAPIEFLFIDAMKSFELANSIKQNFFPVLIPNLSLVVYQDFAHFHTSWIHLIMYRLREYLVPIDHPFMYSSRGFRYVKQIPDRLLTTNWSLADFSIDEVEAAFNYSLEITPKSMQANVMAAKVMYFIHSRKFERASLEFKKATSQLKSNEWRELVEVQKTAKKYYALDLLS
ncbi:glycosyltransferase family 4 protein [Spirulina sp. CS-785/01]|uniref:glycosyltransferase family 4 protein n=1 Tax=Spirulina sp. CS-785/01 TaxID=3021716 RepID=UPI00232EC60E|nr:glycosyltransferase family 4 protein [Spirulina sp. CS-785/01]MDB9315605.1 glycosyltransferase family 4 protein [Spirulina sp. CS-785/01]